MRLITLFLFSLLIAVFAACNNDVINENQTTNNKIDTIGLVNDIDVYARFIDSLKPTLEINVKELSGLSTEGGQILSYYSDADTLMEEVTLYGETGKRVTSYYLRKGSPLFMIDSNITYDRPIGVSLDIKYTKIAIDEYYFYKDSSLIYWLHNKKLMPSNMYKEQLENLE